MKKLFCFALMVAGLMSGCSSGSGSGSPPLPISITLGPSGTQNAVAGQAITITATLTNDSKAAGVTWTLSPLTGAGALSGQTPASVTYTAPSPISANATATITATSVSDSSKTVALTINLQAISVSVSPGSASAAFGTTAAFTATVSNDPGNKGVTWTVTCSVAQCGSVSPTSTASGTATTYSPPSAPPASTLTVMITATSVADSNKMNSATITVPAITVAVTPSTANVPVKGTASFTATVTNDAANKGVSWTLTQGGTVCSPGCGTITGATASGAPATYTAPATAPANPAVTITATSVSDTSKSNTATATVLGIMVSVSPISQSVVVNTTFQFTATVTNDVSNSGVAWTLTQGGAACAPATCGSVAPTTTASGTATTYTAPATVPATPSVTLTATSVADATKFASATITVTLPPPISVSISPTNPTLVVSSTRQFMATVTNDPAAMGVNWTLTQSGVTCAAAVCGAVSPTSGAGNTPMTTYTAPSTVPTPATVTITATSAADPTKSASTTITIASASACNSGNESLLNGRYAFLLKGFDSTGNPALVGGVITVDGAGHITAGDLDMNLNSGFDSANGGNPLAVTGSYSVGSDDRGCMAMTTSAGTQNYRFSLGNISSGAAPVASTGHMIDFDTAGPFTAGVLRLQSGSFANAILKGSYAFGASSVQNAAAGGGKFAVAGQINFNGKGGVTGGFEDFNQNGTLDGSAANTTWPANPTPIDNTGTYSVSNNGRGTLSITFANGHGTSHSVLYVVSSSEALFMTSDSQTATKSTIVAGEALLQSTGGFSGTSLSGSYVGYTSKLGSAAGTTAVNLLLIDVSNPNITGTSSQNDGGTFSSQAIAAGTAYTVDPATGRMVVTGGTNPPVLYIVNSTKAFLLGSNTKVESGFVESQTGSPFSNSSASGTYAFGTRDPQDKSASYISGVANFASSSLNVTEDDNSNGSQTAGRMQMFTYSIDSTTGLGGVPSGCTVSATSTTCQTIFYVISPAKVVVMDAATTAPTVQLADHQ